MKVPTPAAKVQIGDYVQRNDKIYTVTEVRFHGYPRDEEGKASMVSITLDGHWHNAYDVDKLIDVVLI